MDKPAIWMLRTRVSGPGVPAPVMAMTEEHEDAIGDLLLDLLLDGTGTVEAHRYESGAISLQATNADGTSMFLWTKKKEAA